MILKTFNLVVCFFLIFCSTYAQKNYTYSDVKNAKKRFFKSISDNPEISLSISKDMSEGLYKGEKNDSLNIVGYYYMSLAHTILSQADSVNIADDKALSFFLQKPELKQKYLALYIAIACPIAIDDYNAGDYYSASKTLYGLFSQVENNPDFIYEKSRLLFLLAGMYYEIGNVSKAKQLCHKAIYYTYKTNLGSPTVIRTGAQGLLGDIYLDSDLDSTEFYYKKEKAFYSKKTIPVKHPYYYTLIKIARLKIKTGQTQKASDLLNEVKDSLSQLTELKKPTGRYYIAMSELEAAKANYKKEYYYLNRALKLYETLNYQKNMVEVYEKLSAYYNKINDSKTAINYIKLIEKYNDTLNNKNEIFKANEVEIGYKTKLKDAEIRFQEQQLDNKSKTQRLLLMGLGLVLMLSALSIFFYYKRLKAKQRLIIQEKQLHDQHINTLLKSQKLEALKAHLNGQNKERERIAKDLHDSISGNLAAIKLKLSEISSSTNELENVVNDLDNTYEEVRLISHNLVPKHTFESDFVDLIQQLVGLWASNKLSIEADFVTADKINALPDKVQLELYYILKELLTNIHKHSEASEAFINLVHHGDYLSVTLEDNGKGFNVLPTHDGIGLSNINSRLESINGILDIESVSDKGTMVNMTINLHA